MIRLAPLLTLLLPAIAAAWPDDDAWLPVPRDGDPIADTEGDVGLGGSVVDLVGAAADPVALWTADAESLYVRVRTLGDPRATSTRLQNAAWGLLFDLDDEPSDFDYSLLVRGPGGAVQVLHNQAGTDGTQPGVAAYDVLGLEEIGSWSAGDVRVSQDGAYSLDLRLDRGELLRVMGLADTDGFRITVVAGLDPYLEWSDVAGCDGTGSCADLEPALSDTLYLDRDGDGLTDAEEGALGSDPADADTDDDGVLDSAESTADTDGDGKLGFADCDSDDDGILDGTERGVVAAHPDTDTGAGCFRVDVNPDTTTNANARDTDRGGLHDGIEDWNANGRIDDWETDPNDPTDDLDTDGDLIADALEAGWDEDDDGKDNATDLDSDGDGIPDADEWLYDDDEDGVPNFLDADSDGDGIPDADEGSDDTDGDGLPDYRDDDSDDDGIDDREEGTGDSDCDGIPDFQDPVDDDLCDTADTDTDTSLPAWQDGDWTGGACHTAPVALGLFPLVLALAATRRRRWLVSAVAVLAVLVGADAHADPDVNGQRFAPPVDAAGLAVLEDAALAPEGAWGAGLWLDYADDPVVIRYADGRDELRVLGSLLTTHLTGSYSLGRVRVGAEIPLHLVFQGYEVPGVFALGDMRLSGKVGILDRADGIALAGFADIALPTGGRRAWVGGGVFGVHLGAAGGMRFGPIGVAANLGVRTGTGADLGALRLGPALTWGIGATFAPDDVLGVAVELDGDLRIGTGQPGASPVELVPSVRYRPLAGDLEPLLATVAFGAGLSRGIGAPDVRVVAAMGWSPAHRRPEPPPTMEDLCPDQEEDMNGVDDDDGCPDDGLTPVIFDIVSTEGGAIDGAQIELQRGPETGRYTAVAGRYGRSLPPGDYGVIASAEGYRTRAVDLAVPDAPRHAVRIDLPDALKTGHLVVRAVTESGAAVPKARIRVLGHGEPVGTSPDGIAEFDFAPGAYEVSVSADGWVPQAVTVDLKASKGTDRRVVLFPEGATVDRERGLIYLRSKVFFEYDKAALKPESLVVLDDLVALLRRAPDLGAIRIEGHTDTQGTNEYNQALSQRRAAAVRDYLVAKGVPATQLEPVGMGESRPLLPGDSEDVHAINRRVEFHLAGVPE